MKLPKWSLSWLMTVLHRSMGASMLSMVGQSQRSNRGEMTTHIVVILGPAAPDLPHSRSGYMKELHSLARKISVILIACGAWSLLALAGPVRHDASLTQRPRNAAPHSPCCSRCGGLFNCEHSFSFTPSSSLWVSPGKCPI